MDAFERAGCTVSKEWSEAILADIAANRDVVSDAITAKPVGYVSVAAGYLDYLASRRKSHEAHASELPPAIVSMYVYARPEVWGLASQDRPAYRGGVKPDSTIGNAFHLVREGAVPDRGGWDVCYFRGVDVLTFRAGGAHRTLAHMLLGVPLPDGFLVSVCDVEDLQDVALNRSLLIVEDILGRPCLIETDEAASAAKRFVGELTDRHQTRLRSLIAKERPGRRPYGLATLLHYHRSQRLRFWRR